MSAGGRRSARTTATTGTRATGAFPGPDDFPHLRAFLSGYLHQDFPVEHGSPATALAAFLRDARAREREALRRDWQAFGRAIEGRDWHEVRQALASLGGAWVPRSRTALRALFARLSDE